MSESMTVWRCPVHGLIDGGFVGSGMLRPPYQPGCSHCLRGHVHEPREVEAVELVPVDALRDALAIADEQDCADCGWKIHCDGACANRMAAVLRAALPETTP